MRRCDEACAKSGRKCGTMPRMSSEAKFISKTILLALQQRLRRGAGRATGVSTASFTTPVTLPYFLKFWWGRGDINRRSNNSWTVVFNGPKKKTFKAIGQILGSDAWFIRYFGGWVDSRTPGPRTFVNYNPETTKGRIVVRCRWQAALSVDFNGFNGERQRAITIHFPIHSC